ncbi:MAG: hypothetical protein O3A00_02530 [Planctomycetota bacterium]|nr:hypothetical protein [Planctomycetota bacterium]
MKYSALTSLAMVMCSTVVLGQEKSDSSSTDTGAIAWYGTWETGLKAAKASGRPILLVSAAPHCHGISGIW